MPQSSIIPFAPSAEIAIRILCGSDEHFGGKMLARTLIAGDRTLSVPVEGGGSRLKTSRQDILSSLLISDHGRWRQEHLGAWNAAYGRTPYFQHVFPRIEEVYRLNSHGTLAEFNRALFGIVTDILPPDLRESLRQMSVSDPLRLRELREYHTTKVNLNYSIFDAIFRLGKNTIWIC